MPGSTRPSPPTGPAPQLGPRELVALAALLALGAAACALRAWRAPVGFVEICVMRMIAQPLAGTLQTVAADIHPPLMFALRWFAAALLGHGATPQKALSVAIAALQLLPAYLLGRRLFGVRAAWLGTALLALHPLTLLYGSEVEDYALVSLLVLCTWQFAFAWLADRQPLDAVGYVIAAALAAWCEYLTLPLTLLVLVYGVIRLRGDGEAISTWLAMHAGVALLFAPQTPTFLAQYAREGNGAYFHLPSWPALRSEAHALGFDSYKGAALLGGVAAFAVLAPATRAAALGMLMLGTLPVLASRFWVAILPRDMLFLLPPWLLLASAGVSQLPARTVRYGAAVGLLALGAHASWNLPVASELTASAAALHYVQAHAQAGDVIVHAETHSLLFFGYHKASHSPHTRDRVLVPQGAAIPYFEGGLSVPDSLRWWPSDLAAARAAGTRMWCVSLDRAFVTRGVVSRATRFADSCFAAAGAESAFAASPLRVRLLRAAMLR